MEDLQGEIWIGKGLHLETMGGMTPNAHSPSDKSRAAAKHTLKIVRQAQLKAAKVGRLEVGLLLRDHPQCQSAVTACRPDNMIGLRRETKCAMMRGVLDARNGVTLSQKVAAKVGNLDDPAVPLQHCHHLDVKLGAHQISGMKTEQLTEIQVVAETKEVARAKPPEVMDTTFRARLQKDPGEIQAKVIEAGTGAKMTEVRVRLEISTGDVEHLF